MDNCFPPTINDMRQAGVRTYICTGPPKCRLKDAICEFCYVVEPDDRRSIEQIRADTETRNSQ